MDPLLKRAIKKYGREKGRAYVRQIRQAANVKSQIAKKQKKITTPSQPIEMGSATSYTGMQE